MGKASIVYVLGLSTMLAYSLMNINITSTSSLDTYTLYYGRTMAHNIALAGANVGTQLILANAKYSTDLLNLQFGGGYYSMYVENPGEDSAKINVYSRIDVSGETLRDTVIATFKYTALSKYGWFTESERNGYGGSPYFGYSDWKITGDSIFGLAHTNGKFNLAGRPYFNDKVTGTNAPSLMMYQGERAPIFKAGYQWGITVTRPAANLLNIQTAALAGGSLIDVNQDVALTFFPDGTVNTKIPPNSGHIRNDTLPLSILAPTGVIAVRNGDIRLKGTYKGRVTVSALKGVTTNKGNVWLDGNGIVAATNPRTNPSSSDMMGIVAERYTYITRDDTRNSSSVFNIQAAVYCHTGELTAENFWKIGLHGRVNLFGSVSQNTSGSMGIFNAAALQKGFFYTIRHDQRFLTQAPPHYPVSDKYELVSWWEN